MSEHTKGPWTYEYDYATDTGAHHAIIGADRSIVTYMDGDGNEGNNARRIVAAVNATEGIPTEALEGGVVGELLEALRAMDSELADPRMLGVAIPRMRRIMQAAIAKAEGR